MNQDEKKNGYGDDSYPEDRYETGSIDVTGKGRGISKFNRGKIIKILAIIGAVWLILYFIIFKAFDRQVKFVLSNTDIVNLAEADIKEVFKPNEKVYFYMGRKKDNLEANSAVIEIEFMENGDYVYYKKISYEIDKNFNKVNSYIPDAYFSRPGKYRLKLLLDGKEITNNKIEIEK